MVAIAAAAGIAVVRPFSVVVGAVARAVQAGRRGVRGVTGVGRRGEDSCYVLTNAL